MGSVLAETQIDNTPNTSYPDSFVRFRLRGFTGDVPVTTTSATIAVTATLAIGPMSQVLVPNINILPAATFYTVEQWSKRRITSSANYTLNTSGDLSVATPYPEPPIASLLTPVFSPTGGTFTTIQSVTIVSDPNSQATYYTTDGSTPTTLSTLYSGAISVSTSKTLKAISVGAGFNNSPVGAASFTINLPTLATPTFSPAAGTYTSAQSVTVLSDSNATATYYTTDGSTPNSGSTLYTGAITVSSSETIKAISYATGYVTSAVGSAAYLIHGQLATPTFAPGAGSYNSIQSVTITSDANATNTYYTTDGTTPTNASTPYSGAISVGTTETLKAISYASGYPTSNVGSAAYTITLGISLVNSAIAQAASIGLSPATTTGVDTTGANFLVVAVSNYDSNSGTVTITDTIGGSPSGNTWVLGGPSTRYGFNQGGNFYWYVYAANVGANHVFSAAVTGNATPTIAAMAWAGMPSSGSPSSVTSGTGASPFQTPTGLAANAGDLVLATFGGLQPSATVSVDTGFTIAQQDFTSYCGEAAAYLVPGSSGTYTPTWTWTGGSGTSNASIIVFPG
jgi:hypothetical protein